MNLKCKNPNFKFSIFLNYNELPATYFVHERHNGTTSGTLEPVFVPGRHNGTASGTLEPVLVPGRHNCTASGTLEPVLVPGRQCKAELERATRQRPAGKPGRWARARRSSRERSRRASLPRGGGASWVSSLLQV